MAYHRPPLQVGGWHWAIPFNEHTEEWKANQLHVTKVIGVEGEEGVNRPGRFHSLITNALMPILARYANAMIRNHF